MIYPINSRILTAKQFLAKIPDKMPTSSTDHQKTEENVYAFLFFSSSIIEMIKRQINDEFEIFDKENVFYIHGIRKKLKDSGIEKKIKQTIADHFTTPQVIGTKTNTIKSKLWILQTLRNQAMYQDMIQVQNGRIVFSFTIHESERKTKFTQTTKNPHRYFGALLKDLIEFVQQTQKLLKDADTKTSRHQSSN